MRSVQFSNAGSAMRCTKCGLCSCTKFSRYVSAWVANSYAVNCIDTGLSEPKNRAMISRWYTCFRDFCTAALAESSRWINRAHPTIPVKFNKSSTSF